MPHVLTLLAQYNKINILVPSAILVRGNLLIEKQQDFEILFLYNL